MALPGGTILRPALASDAHAIATIMGDALRSHEWMPILHTRAEDLAFVSGHILPKQTVTVAEIESSLLGFIATKDCWINQLHVAPRLFGMGIGSALLEATLRDMPEAQLWCFEANTGARRFYERHGFVEVQRTQGDNEEGLPDILFVRRAGEAGSR